MLFQPTKSKSCISALIFKRHSLCLQGESTKPLAGRRSQPAQTSWVSKAGLQFGGL